MKYKLALNYLSMFDFHNYESWLNDMSVNGFELQKYIGHIIVFKRTNKTERHYKLALQKDMINMNKLAICKTQSWNYITSNFGFTIFSSDNPNDESCFPNMDKQYLRDSLYRHIKAYSLSVVLIFIIMLITVIFSATGHVVFLYLPLIFTFLEQIRESKKIIVHISNDSSCTLHNNWKLVYLKYRLQMLFYIIYYLIFILTR